MLAAVEVVAGGETHQHRVDHVVDEVKKGGHKEAQVLAEPEEKKR